MTCILRVWGKDLVVDELTAATSLKPYRIDRSGERRRNTARVFDHSCAHFEVSDLDFHEFEGQVKEAIRFLEEHPDELRMIVNYRGVEGAVLDFGLAWRDVTVQTDQVPPLLLALAGNLGIGVDLSHYPVSEQGAVGSAGA